MDPRQHWVGKAQLVERLAIVVKRNDTGNLLAYDFGFRIAQRIAERLGLQLEPITELPSLHPDLTLVVAIKAESHSHHAVEAVLIAMPETHQRDVTQVEWAHDGQRRHCRCQGRCHHNSVSATSLTHLVKYPCRHA